MPLMLTLKAIVARFDTLLGLFKDEVEAYLRLLVENSRREVGLLCTKRMLRASRGLTKHDASPTILISSFLHVRTRSVIRRSYYFRWYKTA